MASAVKKLFSHRRGRRESWGGEGGTNEGAGGAEVKAEKKKVGKKGWLSSGGFAPPSAAGDDGEDLAQFYAAVSTPVRNTQPSAPSPQFGHFPTTPTFSPNGGTESPGLYSEAHETLIRTSPMVPDERKVTVRGRTSMPTRFETEVMHGHDPVFFGAFNCELDKVKSAIDNGFDMKTKNKYGETLIHLAASSQNPEALKVVNELIKAGVDAKCADFLKRTPLHLAALAGNGGVLKKLVLLGGDINGVDYQGRTPLHLSIISGNKQSAMLLLYNDCDKDIQDFDGLTPLMLAAKHGHLELVKTLLSYGAKRRLHTKGGEVAVDLARAQGHAKVANVLSDPDLFRTARLAEEAEEKAAIDAWAAHQQAQEVETEAAAAAATEADAYAAEDYYNEPDPTNPDAAYDYSGANAGSEYESYQAQPSSYTYEESFTQTGTYDESYEAFTPTTPDEVEEVTSPFDVAPPTNDTAPTTSTDEQPAYSYDNYSEYAAYSNQQEQQEEEVEPEQVKDDSPPPVREQQRQHHSQQAPVPQAESPRQMDPNCEEEYEYQSQEAEDLPEISIDSPRFEEMNPMREEAVFSEADVYSAPLPRPKNLPSPYDARSRGHHYEPHQHQHPRDAWSSPSYSPPEVQRHHPEYDDPRMRGSPYQPQPPHPQPQPQPQASYYFPNQGRPDYYHHPYTPSPPPAHHQQYLPPAPAYGYGYDTHYSPPPHREQQQQQQPVYDPRPPLPREHAPTYVVDPRGPPREPMSYDPRPPAPREAAAPYDPRGGYSLPLYSPPSYGHGHGPAPEVQVHYDAPRSRSPYQPPPQAPSYEGYPLPRSHQEYQAQPPSTSYLDRGDYYSRPTSDSRPPQGGHKKRQSWDQSYNV